MRAISLKALLLSNLAYFAILVVTMFVAVIAVVLIILVSAHDARSLEAATAAFRSSPRFVAVIVVVPSVLAAIAAGYIAARVAQRGPLVNGALATCGVVLLDLYERVHGLPLAATGNTPALPRVLDLALLIATPLLAMLGGHLAGPAQAPDAATAALERRMRGIGLRG